MSLTCSTWWASKGLLNTRDLMSSLKLPIKDDQIGQCPHLAYFPLFAPVTTEAISKPPLFSHLAVITSLISRPLLFRHFRLLTGQANSTHWRGGRKGKRRSESMSSSVNWWCLEINWFGKTAKVKRNSLPIFSFQKRKKKWAHPFEVYQIFDDYNNYNYIHNLLDNTPMQFLFFIYLQLENYFLCFFHLFSL